MDFYGPLSICQSFSPSVDIQEVLSTGQGQSWCQETHSVDCSIHCYEKWTDEKKEVILASET